MGSPQLDVVNPAVLGAQLIQSGALVQAGFASILQAESEKIEFLLDVEGITVEELLNANTTLFNILEAVAGVEDSVFNKIEAGLFLLGVIEESGE